MSEFIFKKRYNLTHRREITFLASGPHGMKDAGVVTPEWGLKRSEVHGRLPTKSAGCRFVK
jgi:hypothetical protein